ncbi:putative short chain type dehydrogenase [Acrodontium crateriforme]|uniref:Short chain type dehydrogenase n=1 Tax=Acrodontium crateriforme TaxID=150365 RepID=A0AAQ3M3A7_9PEZI|nr:putative short chain type dehydrogenase [Acrodontium crateriforme]
MSPPSKRLLGKIAIITGGSSGIGRAIALAYATHGAKIVIGDMWEKSRNPVESDTTSEVIAAMGGESSFVHVDVREAWSVDALVAHAVELHGRLDIMVNNAGVGLEVNDPQPIWEAKDGVWNTTLQINCNGVFYGTRAAARQMKDQEPLGLGDRGWIVNLASIYGQIAAANNVAYVSSKHLVMGLTKTAALDCAPYRIHVNAICPGFIDSSFTAGIIGEENELRQVITAQHPFRGIGKPEDVAAVAVTLASDDARWMTGSAMTVDGGFSIQ